MSARSARKAKGEGHLRRAEILAAAERIFVREGYAGATIRKVADEVGVSSTALYVHFRDKSEMLFEICQGAFKALTERNAAIFVEPLGAAERVRAMLEAYIEFAMANPNAFWLVFDRASKEAAAGDNPDLSELGRACYVSFEEAVEALAAVGRLTRPVDVTAQAMWAAVHGLTHLLLSKSDFPWADRERIRSALLDALFLGLVRS